MLSKQYAELWLMWMQPREAAFTLPASGGMASIDGARVLLSQLRLAPIDAPGHLGVQFAGSFRTNSVSRSGDHISVGILAKVTPEPMVR
jgi:hypothetical protein